MKRLKVSIVREPGRQPTQVLDSPERVYKVVHDLVDLDREVFEVLHLDARLRLVARETVSVGTTDSTDAQPREVFSGALLNGTKCLILVHNHPSGDPTPSTEDRILTARLEKVAALMGMRVLDHLVVAAGGWASVPGHEAA